MPLHTIQAAIHQAERDADRAEGSVTLIAVSKVQPLDRVEAVLTEGHRVFGENRVQEAAGKWPTFKSKFEGVALHLIGPLQTNKVRQAVELFDAIHTVDRPKLARKLADLAQERGQTPNLMVQVNTGAEPQKAGVLPADLDAFLAECAAMDLPIRGLMCIPPVEEEASLHFALLAKMAADHGLSDLSMGMSADFANAVLFGATHVRVGSAIFGDRVPGSGMA
jgi:pyridoxal phosphate enzyme (YggS family)